MSAVDQGEQVVVRAAGPAEQPCPSSCTTRLDRVCASTSCISRATLDRSAIAAARVSASRAGREAVEQAGQLAAADLLSMQQRTEQEEERRARDDNGGEDDRVLPFDPDLCDEHRDPATHTSAAARVGSRNGANAAPR